MAAPESKQLVKLIRQVISEERELKRISAKDLAQKVGINRYTIYRFERGETEMRLSEINDLLCELGYELVLVKRLKH